jgi:copper homeostasis protein
VSGLLEVQVLHPADAERAEAGGADRVVLVGAHEDGGRSPEPSLVGQVRRATTLPLRVVLRLRAGYGTDGGETTRLHGLLSSYRSVGADGVVMGFLNAHTEIDPGVIAEVLGAEPDFGWTFSRAVDSCISTDRAWRTLRAMPGLDQVHTAGSARGVSEGLEDLLARAGSDPFARAVIMAGGGLLPEHVPWLVRAGIRAFHLEVQARPLHSFKAYVDADLVRTWRELVDDAVGRRGDATA